MSTKGMNRRQFLQTSGLATAGIAAFSTGVVLIAPDGAWALGMDSFDKHTAETLLSMVRVTYPHDTLSDTRANPLSTSSTCWWSNSCLAIRKSTFSSFAMCSRSR